MGEPKLGGGDNAALAALGHGFGRVVGALARLDLDEYQRAPAAGDNVDFAERRFPAPRRDPVAFGDQKQAPRGFPPSAQAGTRRRARAAAGPPVAPAQRGAPWSCSFASASAR